MRVDEAYLSYTMSGPGKERNNFMGVPLYDGFSGHGRGLKHIPLKVNF